MADALDSTKMENVGAGKALSTVSWIIKALVPFDLDIRSSLFTPQVTMTDKKQLQKAF